MIRQTRHPHRYSIALTACCAVAFVTACSYEGDGYYGSPPGEGEGEGGDDVNNQNGNGVTALTAGAWDDNKNFAFFVTYLDAHGGIEGAPDISLTAREQSRDRFAQRQANAVLDIALVVDTTGSMGDELSYLVDELQDIAASIEASAPGASARWSLIVYRDDGDDYVTRVFPFTDDVASLQQAIAQQSAEGGGDYPEASHAALADLVALDWRTSDDVARVAFFVTDAPHHVEREQDMTASIILARDADIHIYPVAASGSDALTELTLRSAAQLTGGSYLFLTDDSGIGDEHSEPTVPCYFVTTLSKQMVRMVNIEMTGGYIEPDVDDVIRTGGDPENGACTLDDGVVVQAM